MPNVDQYESVFRGATRAVYRYAPLKYNRVLVVTDLVGDSAVQLGKEVSGYLRTGLTDGGVEVIDSEAYDNVRSLLDIVEEKQPDLVCVHRNLKGPGGRWPYSLGVYVDVLTQIVRCPVLLLPTPTGSDRSPSADPANPPAINTRDHDAPACTLPERVKTVMAMTDHLAGDDRLVNAAVGFMSEGGTLWLLHVEDEMVFERYMDAISKVPSIDTDTARVEIRKRLLKEPHDYIISCALEIQEQGLDVNVQEVITLGHHLDEYKRLVIEHDVDLLVMNTKDDDQMAMHGLAYPLAVELRNVPMLLL